LKVKKKHIVNRWNILFQKMSNLKKEILCKLVMKQSNS
jgi:hypothetical protein